MKTSLWGTDVAVLIKGKCEGTEGVTVEHTHPEREEGWRDHPWLPCLNVHGGIYRVSTV